MTRIRTVLFDLDGTLIDTAPDMAQALNRLREEHGRPHLAYERIRPHVSHGARAMIRLGFDLEPDHPEFEPLRLRYLDIYRDHLCIDSQLFPGMPALLESITRRGLRWGIVTNKPAFLTEPLVRTLGIDTQATCIVSGDSTANRKPHPEPLELACRVSGSHPGECVYLGDAERDVQAARAAGMPAIVALFGYIGTEDQPQHWGADTMIDNPQALLTWLDRHE